jgi:hypothetical protein
MKFLVGSDDVIFNSVEVLTFLEVDGLWNYTVRKISVQTCWKIMMELL